jgi:hypothetical protein
VGDAIICFFLLIYGELLFGSYRIEKIRLNESDAISQEIAMSPLRRIDKQSLERW